MLGPSQRFNYWKILLNQSITNSRRWRFTYAHELGHFLCHRKLKDSFEDTQRTLGDFRDEIETEANTFASWLLMPANLLRSEFLSLPWHTETLRKMGTRFEASLQASGIRYVSLSTIPIAFIVSRDGNICWGCKSENAPFVKNMAFGSELPNDSLAIQGKCKLTSSMDPVKCGFAWSTSQQAVESNYFDESGLGYQYTCIQFTG